jgi:hypothetical protein
MANIATALKSEISRVARKEVRAETLQLKKQSAHYRSQIAALKRQVAPRASQMPAIAALRKLNKTQAAAAVAQVIG